MLQVPAVKLIISCPDVLRIAVSPRDHLIAAVSGCNIHAFHIHTGERMSAAIRGHDEMISDLRFSDTGLKLATCSKDKTIKLWDIRDRVVVGEPVVLEGHMDKVNTVAWSPDERRIVSGSSDRTVRSWDAITGTQLWSASHDEPVFSVAYSPDGTLVASSDDDGRIALWSADSGDPIGDLLGHIDRVRSVVFSPNGKQIASGSDDKTIRRWDVAARQQIGPALTGHKSMVLAVAFSPDGMRLASVGDDKTLRLWDRTASEPISGHILGNVRSFSVAFSPDGVQIITASQGGITVWNAQCGIAAGVSHDNFPPHTASVNCLALLPSGLFGSGSDDCTLRIWNPDTGAAVGRPLTGHTSVVSAVAVSPDGAMIASGSNDRTVRLWDAHTYEQLGHALDVRNMVSAVCFSSDGKHVLCCTRSSLQAWDVHTRELLADRELPISADIATFGPDQALVACANDRKICLWDLTSHMPSCPPWPPGSSTVSIAFSPDGKHLGSGHTDGTVHLWDLSGNSLRSYEGHSEEVLVIQFSPDSLRIASGSGDQTMRVWDVQSGEFVGRSMEDSSVVSLAFCTDGKRLISGSENGHIHVCDVREESLTSGVSFQCSYQLSLLNLLVQRLRSLLFFRISSYTLHKAQTLSSCNLSTGTLQCV